ncbi:hypothetical protein A2U01_0085739, partial [Trifolium medium]|nr:hypothetical protein [Trifolium medium]
MHPHTLLQTHGLFEMGIFHSLNERCVRRQLALKVHYCFHEAQLLISQPPRRSTEVLSKG